MSLIEFYRDRAATAAREAGEATLPNVRERCLRSEAVWLAMAEQLERTEERKARNRAAKDDVPQE